MRYSYDPVTGLISLDHTSLREMIRRAAASKEKIDEEDRRENQSRLRALGVRCRCAGADAECAHAWPTSGRWP